MTLSVLEFVLAGMRRISCCLDMKEKQTAQYSSAGKDQWCLRYVYSIHRCTLHVHMFKQTANLGQSDQKRIQ